MVDQNFLGTLLTLFLLTSFSISAPVTSNDTITIRLPAPSGPYRHIGTHSLTLTDKSRVEKYAASPNTPRRVVVQFFFPISHASKVDYAPYAQSVVLDALETDNQIPPGTLTPLGTNSHPQSKLVPAGKKLKPILFSTGFGEPRAIYTTMYEDLASEGYFVVAIDHPYDALVVQFPDSDETVYTTISDDIDFDGIAEYLATRVEDAKFVAAALADLPCSARLDLKNVGMLGHSLGGATSLGAMAGKAGNAGKSRGVKVKAGMNLDGTILGPLNATDVKGPYVLVGSEGHGSQEDEAWKSFRRAQTGWGRELEFDTFKHGTFSDLPIVVELLKLEGLFPPGWLEEGLGTVKPKRARKVVKAYVDAFFGWTLKGKKLGLLKGNNKKFPEVTVVEY